MQIAKQLPLTSWNEDWQLRQTEVLFKVQFRQLAALQVKQLPLAGLGLNGGETQERHPMLEVPELQSEQGNWQVDS
jgi:hypothetical protein